VAGSVVTGAVGRSLALPQGRRLRVLLSRQPLPATAGSGG